MASQGSRKRVKHSPSGADSSKNDGASSTNSLPRGVRWYPGAWPASRSSKAAPVTEVARESISMAKNVPSNTTSPSTPLLDTPKHLPHPSLQLTRKACASTRSLPANATTTKINIASDGSASTPSLPPKSDSTDSIAPATQEINKEASNDNPAANKDASSEEPPKITNTNVVIEGVGEVDTSTPEPPSNGWLSWFYTPPTIQQSVPSDPIPNPATDAPIESQPLKTDVSSPTDQSLREEDKPDKPPEVLEVSSTAQKRSWFQMWYGSSSKEPEEPHSETLAATGEAAPTAPEPSTVPSDNSEIRPIEGCSTPIHPNTTTDRPSGWSFWFKEPSKAAATQGAPVEARVGEALPMVQDSPANQQPVEDMEPKPERKIEVLKKGSIKMKPPSGISSAPENLVPATEPSSSVPPLPATEAGASKHLQKILPNQVLPHFADTFALQDRPTILQSISRFLSYNKEANNKHVYKIPHPPRIKKALAIGVHGYFPAPLIRSVLGQPTGTSVRFSTMAAEAIRKYTEDHGYACEIQKIALEGEGRIAERVDLLWKLLLNEMEEIRDADFILIACHSQGVPVTIMLVAKLISFGCLNANRVGICAMAGVNLGPFTDYRSRWISGSAGELFEFALPYSQVSKDYEAALRACINFGIRISYIGSIDDQLVSLESSLFSPVSHPYIYRAVFVDSRVHAPSFVSHLVGFALKLRNLGIPDHGLIRELSTPLAGSLYTGDGHSRLYDEEAVYRLAIEFALETTTIPGATLDIKRNHPPAPANPYILPFAMRGLLEEEYVRRELFDETMELLKQFDDWKPTSKVLKDVKFRLEGIRSKL